MFRQLMGLFYFNKFISYSVFNETMKINFIKTLFSHIPETLKIVLVIILVYGAIALVTYFVW